MAFCVMCFVVGVEYSCFYSWFVLFFCLFLVCFGCFLFYLAIFSGLGGGVFVFFRLFCVVFSCLNLVWVYN